MDNPERPLTSVVIAVGHKFYRNIPQEGALAAWTGGGLEIAIALNQPTPGELLGAREGVFEMGLAVVNEIPWVCFRIFQLQEPVRGFGAPARKVELALGWHECPFHAVRISPEDREDIESFDFANPELRIGVTAVVLDWPSHKVKVLRRFSLSPFFSRELCSAVLDTDDLHTEASYDQEISRLYRDTPVGELGESTRVRCRSGA